MSEEEYIKWHLEHKAMGFSDPIADLFELLYGKEYCDKLMNNETEEEDHDD